MLGKLVGITNEIYNASDRAALLGAMGAGCSALGFDTYLLFCHKSSKPEMILNSTLTNFTDGFLADYEQLGWSDADFMLDRMLETVRPLAWDARVDHYDDIRCQSYIDFLHANRMGLGVIVPLQSRPGTASAFSLISETDLAVSEEMMRAAIIMANAAMTKAEILGLCEEISPDAANATRSLTDVQHEILNWIAEGKSNVDIATILNLNKRTVRYHVTEILRKFGVATRMQAAAIRQSPHFDPRG